MCGRFTLTRDVAEFATQLGLQYDPAKHNPRFNICPSQPVIVILNDENQLELTTAKWGLIPSWAKDPSIGNKLANARADGIDTKPSFRSSFKRRRCLVLADGFYEWTQKKPKVPYYFRLHNRRVFAFAGLWDIWRDEKGEEISTCCLITTEPNSVVAQVHTRMPVILQSRFYRRWLSAEEQPPDTLLKMLQPYPANQMEAFEVSTFVNMPQNNEPRCIIPVSEFKHVCE
jgi:putative SOS response-associated peptidase YedK